MLWYGSGKYKKLTGIPKDQILVFDTETTGLSSVTDKILQITILDGNGMTLFSSYLKPGNRKHWPAAERVNHISYEMVKDAPTFRQVRGKIQSIFNKAKLIVGYNLSFDLDFLSAGGIILSPLSETFDVMTEFGHFQSVTGGELKRYKLTGCAQHYGYTYNAHNAESDAQATLYCFDSLLQDSGYIEGVNKYREKTHRKTKEVVSTDNTNTTNEKKLKRTVITKRLAYIALFFALLFLSINLTNERFSSDYWFYFVKDMIGIFMFCFLCRAIFPQGHYKIPLITWIISLAVEISQGVGLLNIIGAEENMFLINTIGGTFSFIDIVFCTIACVSAGLIQKIGKRFFLV